MSEIIQGLDRVAAKIVGSLHNLFGFQYSRNAEHYIYHASVAVGSSVAVGGTLTGAFRITQEADFIATRLNGILRINSSGIVVGTSSATTGAAGDPPDFPYALQITDGGTDRQLHSEPVDFLAAYGQNGGLPGVWARPRLFARNSIVTFQLQALKALGAAATARLSLIGWKVYDARSLNLTS